MPKGKKKSGRKPKKVEVVMVGSGFWDSLKNAAVATNNYLKDTKLISKASGALKDTPGIVGSVATNVNKVSSALGYGQKGRGYKL